MTRGALAGLRIIVTRPAHQSDALCRLLEAQGAETARLPLVAIDASGDDAEQRAQLEAHRGDEGWIFTSANAVARAAELDKGRWPSLYAVGGATAAALDRSGHPGAVMPTGTASSEALLDLPALQQVDGRPYLIVTGEGGRDLLAEGLAARGARVTSLPLYRRRPLDLSPARVEAELAVADAAVISSGEALDLLWAATPPASRPALLQLQLLVPSERVAAKALARGFAAPLVVDAVSDEAYLRCLVQWRVDRDHDSSMTTNQAETSPLPASIPMTPAARGSSAILPWLLVLILAGALGYGGWLFWDLRQNQDAIIQAQDHALRRLARQADDLTALGSTISTRQSDLGRTVERQGNDLASVQGRLDNSEQLMGRVTDELSGGRTRFALASVEQLLLLAGDRLLLQHDVRSALLALQIADERLAALADPRLFRVREAIAGERTQLQALPRPDLTSASLTLSALIDRADALPLRARATPQNFGVLRSTSTALATDGNNPSAMPAWKRVWYAVRRAVSGLFLIRRDDKAGSLRLLPAEDEAVIGHVLILRLEAARVAMLRGETEAFREAMSSAADWLRQFYAAEDDGVITALAELDRLQALELSAPAPDVGGSLKLLREQLNASASAPARP